MALAKSEMFRVAQMGGNTIWFHVTNDTKANVIAANYFNIMAAELQKGDIIFVAGDVDGTPFTCPIVVLTNNGTTVTHGYGVVS